MKTARTINTTKRYWWATEQHHQGQMVTEMYPQLAGCAEGEEGQAEGLRLKR